MDCGWAGGGRLGEENMDILTEELVKKGYNLEETELKEKDWFAVELEYQSRQDRNDKGQLCFEFPIIILASTLGMILMISSYDLIIFYLGLELQSLCLYILASFKRDDERSTEAGLKYFVLSALASGLLLYGCSLIYGFTAVSYSPLTLPTKRIVSIPAGTLL